MCGSSCWNSGEAATPYLLISEDLDEILALSDRIAVIYEGQIMDILDRAVGNTRRSLACSWQASDAEEKR